MKPARSLDSVPQHPLASIRRILFPTDLSAESWKAFEHARFLAERFGADLTVYHVAESRRPVGLPRYFPFPTEEEWAREAEAAARAELARRLGPPSRGREVAVEARSSVARALVSRVRETQPDLTVMATHGREGLAHFFLGSVTERVVNHARRPVLCVREPAHGTALPYRRILVPTDLSLASRRAFPMAALLAQEFDAEVLMLNVYTPQPVTAAGAAPRSLTVSPPTEAAVWRFAQPDFTGLDVTALTTVGTVWDRIVDTAGVEKADVVVMATRGLDSLSDRILGSNTERVVRHAACPVLVV
jgi:nucleotide-binding universal stress UspA family protein